MKFVYSKHFSQIQCVHFQHHQDLGILSSIIVNNISKLKKKLTQKSEAKCAPLTRNYRLAAATHSPLTVVSAQTAYL